MINNIAIQAIVTTAICLYCFVVLRNMFLVSIKIKFFIHFTVLSFFNTRSKSLENLRNLEINSSVAHHITLFLHKYFGI